MGNPLRYVDPSGYEAEVLLLGCAVDGPLPIADAISITAYGGYNLYLHGSQIIKASSDGIQKIVEYFTSKSSSTSSGTPNPNDPKFGKGADHFGSKGPTIYSKTIWKNGKTERLDIENPTPGKCDANIHYHESNNTKWYLDVKNKYFYQTGKNGEIIKAPNKIQNLLKSKEFQNNINKGLKYLNENSIF